jgi:putative transcriptional regulator
MRIRDPVDVKMQDLPNGLAHAATRQRIEAHEHDAVRCKPFGRHGEQSVPYGRRHPRIDTVRDDVVEGAERRRKRGQVFFDERHIRELEFRDRLAAGRKRARRQIAADEVRGGKPHSHRNQVGAIVATNLEDTACRNRRRIDAQERCYRCQPVRMRQWMRQCRVRDRVVASRKCRVGRIRIHESVIVAYPPSDYNCTEMGGSVNLTHHFLIAMPAMADPHFAHTLTYICEHNKDGALGIVVNKPIDMTLSALFEQINIPLGDSDLREAKVHYGGPVQIDRGFVLHRPLGSWQSTLAISDDLGLTTSKDILEAVGHGNGPANVLVTLGYAGWSADQLEQEIAQNAWLTVAADPQVLFAEPAELRLPAAMKLLGIDFSRLSDSVGHA